MKKMMFEDQRPIKDLSFAQTPDPVPARPEGSKGITSREINERKALSQACDLKVRTYNRKEEHNRSIERQNRNMTLQLEPSYKSVVPDSLWNHQRSLSPKNRRYHKDELTFKRHPQNLDSLEQAGSEEKWRVSQRRTMLSRSLALKRTELRNFENRALMLKSSLQVKNADQIKSLEASNPQMFDDILARKKFSYVQKDPQRSLRNKNVSQTEILNNLNHLPEAKVRMIMDQEAISRDMQSCQQILKRMYEDFQNEEIKLELRRKERDEQRQKVRIKHEQNSERERSMGICLGNLSRTSRSPDQCDSLLEVTMTDNSMDQSSSQIMLNMSKVAPSLSLKFDQKVTKPLNRPRQDILAMARPENKGKDLFQRPEFRGLILSDYQSAAGERARDSVAELNRSSVSKFPQLRSFQESFRQKKMIETFYKNDFSPKQLKTESVTKYNNFDSPIRKQSTVELNTLRRSHNMWNKKLFQTLDHCSSKRITLQSLDNAEEHLNDFEKRVLSVTPVRKSSKFPSSRLSDNRFFNVTVDFQEYGKPHRAPGLPRQ